MSAPDNRLIGVVGVEMKPAARENAGENIAGRGDALAVLAADADCEIYFRKWFPPVTDGTILPGEAPLGKFTAPPMRSLPGYWRAMQGSNRCIAHYFPVERQKQLPRYRRCRQFPRCDGSGWRRFLCRFFSATTILLGLFLGPIALRAAGLGAGLTELSDPSINTDPTRLGLLLRLAILLRLFL